MKYLKTILIVGKDEKRRKEKIDAILKDLNVHPVDITHLTPDPSIGIEEVRKFLPNLYIAPSASEYRVIIFHDLGKATPEAQNALLKTFEEPPHKVFLVSHTEDENSILPTILSRTQIIYVHEHQKSERDISERLKVLNGSIAQKISFVGEKIKTKEDALLFIDEMTKTLRSELLEINGEGKRAEDLTQTIQKFQKARGFIVRNINTRLTMEILLFSCTHPA